MNTHLLKLRQLKGEEITDLPPDEVEALKKTDLKKLLDNARKETYNYCCEKTEDGTGSIIHDSGKDRFKSGIKSLKTIDEIADTCNLISPAEKLLNQTKREMLAKRHDKEWAEDFAETYAATSILAMSIGNGNKSFEEQSKYLHGDKFQEELDKIKGDPAFQRMMQNEGIKKTCDNIVKGKSSLTNAFFEAKAQVMAEQNEAGEGVELLGEKAPKDMTNEEKRQIWANNPIKL